jgi:hypothetical protein
MKDVINNRAVPTTRNNRTQLEETIVGHPKFVAIPSKNKGTALQKLHNFNSGYEHARNPASLRLDPLQLNEINRDLYLNQPIDGSRINQSMQFNKGVLSSMAASYI